MSCKIFLTLTAISVSTIGQIYLQQLPAVATTVEEKITQKQNFNYTGVVEKVDRIAKDITVRIDKLDDSENGSGVIIAREGNTYYVATAKHVLCQDIDSSECESIGKFRVVTPDGISHQLDIQTINASQSWLDVAIFKFESSNDYGVATLGKYTLGKEWVFLSAFPRNRNTSRLLTGGKTIQQEETSFRAKEKESLKSQGKQGLIYSNISSGGMSGGAVLDSEGRLIGIHTGSENEIEIDSRGELGQFSLGFSLGVGIGDILGLIAKEDRDLLLRLQIENSTPSEISQATITSIQEQLQTADRPKQNLRVADWLNYANQLWRYEEYEAAIDAFQRVIELDPDYDRSYYGMGLAHWSQGISWNKLGEREKARQQFQQAVDSFKQATEINPNPYYYWRWLGLSYQYLERYNLALSAYDNAVAKNQLSQDFILYVERGDILKDLGKYNSAIASYNYALTLNPNHPWIYNNRGIVYDLLQQYNRAFADYDRAISLNPQDEKPYINKGSSYDRLGQYRQAILEYHRALKLDVNNADIYFNLGLAHSKLQEYYRAIRFYDLAIVNQKNYFEAYSDRGNAYGELQQYNKALEDFDRAIEIEPQFADGYYNRGVVYYELKEYQKAIADYDRATELAPNNAKAYNNRGFAYYRLKEYPKAISDLEKAIKLNPNFPTPYNSLGAVYVALNRYDIARENYYKAIELEPNNTEAYNNLGIIYTKEKQFPKAIDNYSQAIKINPQYLDAHYGRAIAYNSLQQHQQAVKDLTQVIKLDSQYTDAYFNRALAYQKLQKYRLAKVDLDRTIAFDPNNANAYLLRAIVTSTVGEYSEAKIDARQAANLFKEQKNDYGYRDALKIIRALEAEINKNKISLKVKKEYTGIVGKVDKIAEQVTVRIATQDNPSHGSGVIIAREDNIYYVATVKHNFSEHISNYRIVTTDGIEHQLDLQTVKKSDAYDLAIFSFESNNNYQVASFAKTNKNTRQVIFVSGFPKLNDRQPQRIITGGKIRKDDVKDFIAKDAYSLQDKPGLVYSNISSGGMSGGAVLDSEGKLIGIHTASEDEIDLNTGKQFGVGYSLGVSIEDILNWLKTKLNSQPLTIASNPATEVRDKDWENIKNQLLIATQPNEESITAWMNYGNQLWRYLRLDEAIEAYQKVIELDPNSDKAYYAMGLIYFFAGNSDFQQAAASFKKATQINPQIYYYWTRLGSSHEALEQYNRSLTAFNRAIALNPKDFTIYVRRGDTLFQAKRYAKAIESYSQGIDLNPNHPWAYLNRAISYNKLGQHQQELADYNKEIELNPSAYDYAYTNRGSIYQNLQQYNKAISNYNKAIEINPDNVIAYSNRGVVYSRLEGYSKAISDLDRAIEINSEYAPAYNNRGIVLAKSNQNQNAIADFEKAIEIDPNYTEAYLNLGSTYSQLKQEQKAVDYSTQAIKINPNYANAYFNRRLSYYRLKNPQQTRKDWSTAASLYQQQDNTEKYRFILKQLEKLNAQ